MKTNLNEKIKKEYDEIFNFIENSFPIWERLETDGQTKIKTNQEKVAFTSIEKILKKFNLRITDVSMSTYYGIVFGIEKL
jgi:hypothetical protein